MTYKEELTQVMTNISKIDNLCFIGYNVAHGHQFNGTLVNVCPGKLQEMPVAENLIMGVAIGLALEGFRPVVCLERMDFLWACADAIVNHLDKAKTLGWPPLNVIIRTCVGSTTPLNPGVQHCGDYVTPLQQLLNMDIIPIYTANEVKPVWEEVMKCTGPVMVVEYREKYSQPTLPTVSSKASGS